MTEREQREPPTQQPESLERASAGALKTTKILRVGVMRRGTLAEERTVRGGQPITIGSAESNLFILPNDDFGASFILLTPNETGGGYRLNFTDAMSGRVAFESEPKTLEALKREATQSKKGVYSLLLTDNARGKITVGTTSFLIQFVRPKTASAQMQLPPRMMTGNSALDWPITIIAAFSFLFHFGAIGIFYSDWADRVLEDEASLVGLVDRMQRLPPPPAVETPKSLEENNKNAQQAKDSKVAAANQGAKANAAGPAKGAVSKSDGAALLNKLDQMDAAMIGALVSNGAATQGVLKDGNVPTSGLDELAAAASGVGALGPGGLKISGGGGPVLPGGGGGDLASLGSGSGADGTTGTSGATTKVEGPKANVSGTGKVSVGKVSGADRVLAAARGRVRACYQSGLNTDPEMEGKVSFTLSIGASGSVSSANVTPSGNITGGVISCIQSVLQGLAFDAPEDGTATMAGSFSFVNSTKGK